MGRKTGILGCLPLGNSLPEPLDVWAPLFYRASGKACSGHLTQLHNPVRVPPMSLKFYAIRGDVSALSASHSPSMSPPPRRRRHPELLRFGAEAGPGLLMGRVPGTLFSISLPYGRAGPHPAWRQTNGLAFPLFFDLPAWIQGLLAFAPVPACSTVS